MLVCALPALILIFLIWPLTLGATLGIKNNLDRYLIGFAAVQALFFIVYVPAICFSWSSRVLTYTAAIIITVVGIGGALLRYYRAPSRKDFLALSKPNLAYLKNPFFLIAICIILYEMWIYATKEPYIYGDDVTYMTLVTRFVDTNSIYTKSWAGQVVPTQLSEISYKYVFTSYYPFLGMISILSSIHPLILCKTILPLIYLPTHYLIVWRIASYLFSEEQLVAKRIEKKSLFLLFYSVLIEFGQISYYTLSRRVTIWIYNGKSDCFCLLLIILFFYLFVFLTEASLVAIKGNSLEYMHKPLLVVILALACISSTLMGLLFSGIVMLVWYIIFAFRARSLRLLITNLWTLIPHLVMTVLIVAFITT